MQAVSVQAEAFVDIEFSYWLNPARREPGGVGIRVNQWVG